jgi:chromosome segregation ATPase
MYSFTTYDVIYMPDFAIAAQIAVRHPSSAHRKGVAQSMPKPKKVITEFQKQILQIRRETEEKKAEKAATEEQINRLSFTLSLYQAEKTMDETIQEKIDSLKDHISELELRARQLPRAIRKLKAQQRKLRSSEHAPQ